MRLRLSLMAAVSLGVSAPASAVTIDFEDLVGRQPLGSPGWDNWDTYQGYIWGYGTSAGVAGRLFNGSQTGWATAWPSDPAINPPPASLDGQVYAWTYSGPQSLWIDFQAATDVNSVDLAILSTNYFSNSATVQLLGYDGADNLIGATGPFVLTDTFQTLSANLSGVRYLELRSDRNGSWFSVDNLTLNSSSGPPVPEPATWAMLITGLGLVGASLRSRRRVTVRFAV